jgi:tetratricopeptide (TPR) repeat protein
MPTTPLSPRRSPETQDRTPAADNSWSGIRKEIEKDKPANPSSARILPERKGWQRLVRPAKVIGVMIAVATLGTSFDQAHVARQQNRAAEQQNLVTLVAQIAQEPGTQAQEASTFKGDTAAFDRAEVGSQLTELADSEEAVNTISALHGRGVTATEYYVTAIGLESSDSYAQALSYLQKAANLDSDAKAAGLDQDPRTRSDIFLTEGEIFYRLGHNTEAERAMELAEGAFQGVPDVTNEQGESNRAYTLLVDAQYQASINCGIAKADISQATNVLAATPSALTTEMTTQRATDEADLRSCSRTATA